MERRAILSIPSRPDASTKPRAERAKLSRRTALPATIGKMALAWLPPIDKMTCRCGCFCLRCIKEPKPPDTPSHGALKSAYSSLSYSKG